MEFVIQSYFGGFYIFNFEYFGDERDVRNDSDYDIIKLDINKLLSITKKYDGTRMFISTDDDKKLKTYEAVENYVNNYKGTQ